jgi:hypothetical protein
MTVTKKVGRARVQELAGEREGAIQLWKSACLLA